MWQKKKKVWTKKKSVPLNKNSLAHGNTILLFDNFINTWIRGVLVWSNLGTLQIFTEDFEGYGFPFFAFHSLPSRAKSLLGEAFVAYTEEICFLFELWQPACPTSDLCAGAEEGSGRRAPREIHKHWHVNTLTCSSSYKALTGWCWS